MSDDSDYTEEEDSGNRDNSEKLEQSEGELNIERVKIKAKLNEMSFEDLQKLRTEMGMKLYDKEICGYEGNSKVENSLKRANKNRPREMSSKKAVSVKSQLNTVKKSVARDPRFESTCGTFDKKSFKNNYKFVNDVRKKEKEYLEKELSNTTDKNEKRKIKLLIQRLHNHIREDEKDRQDKQEYGVNTQMKEIGPKKKSVKKLESLITKFEELKETNKIQKHLERKSKKIFVKERKHLERQKLL